MNTLLKECVQAKTNETRSMVGGTNHGKEAGVTEIMARKTGDVPVHDVAEKALPGLSEGAVRDAQGGRRYGDTSSASVVRGRRFRVLGESFVGAA